MQMLQPLCTTSYLLALSKASTGNPNLYLSFKFTSHFFLHQTGSFEGLSDISLYFANYSASKVQQWLKACTLLHIYLYHRQ